MLGARARVLQDMISEARSRGLDPDEQASLAALLEGLRRLLSGERQRPSIQDNLLVLASPASHELGDGHR